MRLNFDSFPEIRNAQCYLSNEGIRSFPLLLRVPDMKTACKQHMATMRSARKGSIDLHCIDGLLAYVGSRRKLTRGKNTKNTRSSLATRSLSNDRGDI